MGVTVSAAHFLPGYDGDCHKLHGHNWRIGISLACNELSEQGFVLDFKKVKAIVNGSFDHSLINDVVPNPTAENIAKYIADELTKAGQERVYVTCISVEETDGHFIRYYPGEAMA